MSESPERLCIVTGERLPVNALIRFVVSPEGEVVPDLKHELPGRGVWVKARAETVARAVADGRFAKAFRAACRADSEMPRRIAGLIRADARQYLALANKAGLVAVGFERTAEALDSGKARVLIEAAGSLTEKFLAAARLAEAFGHGPQSTDR